MRATIQWSYDLLEAEEQALFRRLSVFRGFTLEAAENVGIAPSLGPKSTTVTIPPLHLNALVGVASLVDKSLLRLEEDRNGQPWYVMLETVREFALEQLEVSGESPAVRRRHSLFCLRIVEEARGGSSRWTGLGSAEEAELLNGLEHMHANCRAALEWCQAQGYAELCLRMAVGLWWFWSCVAMP